MTRWTEAHAAHGALFLDELLRHPEYATIATEIRKAAPISVLDQGDAAAQHIYDGFTRMAQLGICEMPPPSAPEEYPDWIRLGITSTISTWVTGRGDTCMHSPNISRPQPVVGAAWKPRLVTCGDCTHLFHLGDAAKDATCDACGRITTGAANGDGIASATAVLGFVTWLFGACGNCKFWNEEAS